MFVRLTAAEGASLARARSFVVTTSGASATAGADIAAGAYGVFATNPCVLAFGASPTATALPSTQPAATSPNASLALPANVFVTIDVATATQVSVIRIGATDAAVSFSGPLAAVVA